MDAKYSKLSTDEGQADKLQEASLRKRPSSNKAADDEPEYDARFDTNFEDPYFPWKEIGLALFLFFLGVIFLTLAYFILSGHMKGERDQGYGFLTIGILVFLPGFYETRIAYYAMRGYEGYAFSQMPQY